MNPVEETRKNNFLMPTSKRYENLLKKAKNFNLKNLVDKMHKLIIKELKLNLNYHIKTCRNHNLLQI
jgi:hypothetical protein